MMAIWFGARQYWPEQPVRPESPIVVGNPRRSVLEIRNVEAGMSKFASGNVASVSLNLARTCRRNDLATVQAHCNAAPQCHFSGNHAKQAV